MANRPQILKVRDVQKVIRAARSAGVGIDTIECDPATGKIRITTTKPAASEQQTEGNNVEVL
jgi:ssDNA-binding replication factor A large subunit